MSCHIRLYHIAECHITSLHIISYHIVLYYITLYLILLYHIISYIISYHIPYHIALRHIVSNHIALYFITYHIISYYDDYRGSEILHTFPPEHHGQPELVITGEGAHHLSKVRGNRPIEGEIGLEPANAKEIVLD